MVVFRNRRIVALGFSTAQPFHVVRKWLRLGCAKVVVPPDVSCSLAGLLPASIFQNNKVGCFTPLLFDRDWRPSSRQAHPAYLHVRRHALLLSFMLNLRHRFNVYPNPIQTLPSHLLDLIRRLWQCSVCIATTIVLSSSGSCRRTPSSARRL